MSGVVPTDFKGSTSVLFVYQKSKPNVMYRLDYGPIVKGPQATPDNVWHHNLQRVQQKLNLSVDNHSTGPGARAAGRAITIYKWGGTAMFVAGMANSGIQIYYAEDRMRETVVQVSGWAGAWAGARIGAAGGARGGAWVGGAITSETGGWGAVPGAVVGGLGGGLVGGGFGFWGTSTVTGHVYDSLFYPLEKEEWQAVTCP
jgi:hypothetical protein